MKIRTRWRRCLALTRHIPASTVAGRFVAAAARSGTARRVAGSERVGSEGRQTSQHSWRAE